MHKEKMKVYHGIPKSVTDEHTVFYASLDGNTETTIGDITATKLQYVPSVTGYGTILYSPSILPLNYSTKYLTTDYWVIPPTSISSSTGLVYFIKNTGDYNSLGLYITSGGALSVALYDSTLNFISGTAKNVYPGFISKFGGKPTHLRLTINPKELKVYINGNLAFEEALNNTGNISFEGILIGAYRTTSTGIVTVGGIVALSDVHISDIDRGDYFPNLPQDFIEGKAIIKPRMSQQQIKGDPLYSQVTELLVDSSTKLPKPYSNIANSDGTYTHLYKPELSVLNANLWNNTSKLKIKGLNGEIISGVIDSDTALFRILRFKDGKPVNSTLTRSEVVVDSVSKLSVGDTIKPHNLSSQTTYNITNIDNSNNCITLHLPLWEPLENGGIYAYETTTSSSSPVVKTQDGTTVVGTWSGLGTNEATFTLGDNTGLKGKDLYVTYSLNIPNGNSDFTELPYSVDRAYNETGLEMKPVSEIVIEDDFRGKVMGDLVNCPHISKFHNYTTLVNPTDNWAGELPTSNYNLIQSLDGTTNPVLNTLNNHIPQQLFSFNLIEMVERKLGCEIPSRDKVQWLKDNIINHTITHYGYGVCPNGNKLYFRVLNGSSWNGTWEHSRSSSDTPTKCYWKGTGNKPGGFIHFLVYTDASDGVTQSAIYTDYVNLEIKLKTDSTFTTLYCDNKRAREDSCNPVLVQKETKTVKRYLPSKECFVTECSYLPYRKNASLNNGIIMAIQKEKVVSTCGTGSYVANDEQGAIKDYLHILPPLSDGSQPYDYFNEVIWIKGDVKDSTHSHTLRVPIVRYWGGKLYNSIGATNTLIDSCTTLPLANEVSNYPRYEFYGVLKNVKGELFLTIQVGKVKPLGKGLPWTNKDSVLDYKLPNRPLIK